MNDRPTTGLRHLPLSQYLLRGQRSNAASQYDELHRLQQEQMTVTPMSGGPFRLFVFQQHEAVLRSIGMDRTSLLKSLNTGIDVVVVNRAKDGVGGTVVGLIDKGRVRVVLRHELEPPAPADWRLLRVEPGMPQVGPLAVLTATWCVNRRQRDASHAGNATVLLSQFVEVVRRQREWVASWRPPVVSPPFLMFHLDRDLTQNAALKRLLDGLRQGTPLFHCRLQKPAKFAGGKPTKLTLYAPDHQAVFVAYPPPFSDTGANEWLLAHVQDAPDPLIPVVRLDVRCYVFTRQLREQFQGVSDPHGWLAELERWHQHYEHWRLHEWPVEHISSGLFNLRVSHRAQVDLQSWHVSPDELCSAMSRGLRLFELSGRESDVVVAVPDGLDYQIRLTPYTPSMGGSDWRLIDVSPAESARPCFARIIARWVQGIPGQPPLSGDAPGLIRALTVLQDRRQEVGKTISDIERLADNTRALSTRIECWRKVCALERDLLNVGVTHLARDGQDFVLIPEEHETVGDWLYSLQGLNPEGIEWDRYPLELELGNDSARLVIRSLEFSEGDELVLKVTCEHPRGKALIDSLCDSGSGTEEQGKIRLFLPDTQLRLIDDALTTIDPEDKTRSEKRRIMEKELLPDDLTLGTLRAILATPQELDPISVPWPPLPIPPLTQLSQQQELAVRAAIFGPDMLLIQGPPGTGKTTVILEILRQLFLMHGKTPTFKVLLVAPTHVAVDNVLERLVTPRGVSNLVMELGVAPYRVGSTLRIPEHLRAYTPDCFSTKYREELERNVDQAVVAADRECERDLKVLEVLEDGAARDAVSWWCALQAGELLDLGPWEWAPSLASQLPEELNNHEGRVRTLRHCRAQGTRPKERADLLRRWRDFLGKNSRFFSELLVANANLVCATTIGCATHPELRSVVYDYVIVDEAGKEEARRLLVPLIRGERWVLVGDHQQLPPYADDVLQARLHQEGVDPQIMTRSLFEELQPPFEQLGRYVFLNQQGRMHPDISAFVSQRFYGGRLTDFPQVAAHTMSRPAFLPETPALLVLDTRELSDRTEARRRTGYVNLLEQELALHLLRSFATLPAFQGGSASAAPTVGVIAPYRLQVEGIERQARKDSYLNELLREGVLHIGTVDSFQGQERDLVIFTCTRSNNDGRLGFVDNRQRLNVALSRARCRLIVIADGLTVDEARCRTDISSFEAETRDHLHALFQFAKSRNGIVEVPEDWRTRWRE